MLLPSLEKDRGRLFMLWGVGRGWNTYIPTYIHTHTHTHTHIHAHYMFFILSSTISKKLKLKTTKMECTILFSVPPPPSASPAFYFSTHIKSLQALPAFSLPQIKFLLIYSGLCKRFSCITEAIQPILALQCLIKCTRNNNNANRKFFFLNGKIRKRSVRFILSVSMSARQKRGG